MGIIRNIKQSLDDKSSMSVNSISVLASVFMGIVIGFVISFVLVYDVTYDGKVDTNLTDLGIFLLCGGGYIISSSASKAFVDGKMKMRSWVEGEKLQIDAEDEGDNRTDRKSNCNNFCIVCLPTYGSLLLISHMLVLSCCIIHAWIGNYTTKRGAIQQLFLILVK